MAATVGSSAVSFGHRSMNRGVYLTRFGPGRHPRGPGSRPRPFRRARRSVGVGVGDDRQPGGGRLSDGPESAQLLDWHDGSDRVTVFGDQVVVAGVDDGPLDHGAEAFSQFTEVVDALAVYNNSYGTGTVFSVYTSAVLRAWPAGPSPRHRAARVAGLQLGPSAAKDPRSAAERTAVMCPALLPAAPGVSARGYGRDGSGRCWRWAAAAWSCAGCRAERVNVRMSSVGQSRAGPRRCHMVGPRRRRASRSSGTHYAADVAYQSVTSMPRPGRSLPQVLRRGRDVL